MKPRILIVDDHDDFRTLIKDYLNSQGLNLEIFEASTGEMGVTKASCVKPDIVLMDVSLPNANGILAAKHIKEDNPNCDVIILTVFEVKAFKRNAQEIKVRDFIGKNEVYDRLIPVIKRCLKEKIRK